MIPFGVVRSELDRQLRNGDRRPATVRRVESDAERRWREARRARFEARLKGDLSGARGGAK